MRLIIFFDISVGAVNGIITGVEIPIVFFFDRVPLFYRSVIANVGKFSATLKCAHAD